MAGKDTITDKILKLMDEKPYERTLKEIRSALNMSDYEIRGRVKSLRDRGELVVTRKMGAAEVYCKAMHKNKVM